MLPRIKLLTRRSACSGVGRRGLILPKNSTDPQFDHIVIGNNTAVIAALVALERHTEEEKRTFQNRLDIFVPPFWLEDIAKSPTWQTYQSFYWGQSIQDLPESIQKLMKEHFDRVDGVLTWADYWSFLGFCKQRLAKKYNASFHYFVPHISPTPTELKISGEFPADMEYPLQSAPVQSHTDINMPDRAIKKTVERNVFLPKKKLHLYEWYRKPAVFKLRGMAGDSYLVPGVSKLYLLDQTTINDKEKNHFIIFGDGISAIWAHSHFPLADIIFVIQSTPDELKEKLTAQKEKRLRYGIPHWDLINFDIDTFLTRVISRADFDSSLSRIYSEKGNTYADLGKGVSYACFHSNELTPSNTLSSLTEHGHMFNHQVTIMPTSFSEFRSTNPDVGPGSMVDSFLTYFDCINQIEPELSPSFHHVKNNALIETKFGSVTSQTPAQRRKQLHLGFLAGFLISFFLSWAMDQ